MNIRIPLAKPEITDCDRAAVMEVLRTPHLSMGPKLREFEQAVCVYTGSKHAVAINSGTSALHLAIRTLRLPPGAEVILPSFTFSALLNVIQQERLRPKFVDIDLANYNTTPEMVAAAVSSRTGLILAVHTFGFPFDVRATRELLDRTKPIPMIEDACEAFGAEVHGSKAGSLGAAGLFAFYPNKQITTGEGGMLVTPDAEVAQTAAQLRNQGRDPRLGWNQHAQVGFSYRISDINCALGLSQLSRIETFVAKRQKLAEAYDRELAEIAEIVPPPVNSNIGRISWFVYPARLQAEFTAKDRDVICQSLLRKGIATGRYFAPLHRQPVLDSAARAEAHSHLANTEFAADRMIALPFFNQLTESEIHEVCRALEESIRELRRKT